MTDWNTYIPHKLCTVALNGVAGYICKNCMAKNWYDTALHYGMSEKDASQLIEGQTKEGGGRVLPVRTLDNRGKTPTSTHTGPIDYD